MIKDILLAIGTLAGLSLSGAGLIIWLTFYGDNPDADALASGVRYFIGIPCLAAGLPLLALCVWGLSQ